ncbi:MAG: hypothetical protein AAGI53_16270 [Planctomycetota bacterium]
MDRDYFTADLHLGHLNILKHAARTEFMTDEDRAAFERAQTDAKAPQRWRPSQRSLDRMDARLIERINSIVPAEATLWVIGDFVMTRESRVVAKYRSQINCADVRIVWGNHDSRNATRPHVNGAYDVTTLHIAPQRTYTSGELDGDRELRRQYREESDGRSIQSVFLSHYAHAVWNKSHHGVYHLYGHSHGNLESWRQEHMPNALAMDIGVDRWGYRPVGWSQIDQILGEKRDTHPPHVIDHHGPRRCSEPCTEGAA